MNIGLNLGLDSGIPKVDNKALLSRHPSKLNIAEWQEFEYYDIFNIERGKESNEESEQDYLVIGASQNDNGSNGEYCNLKPYYDGNLITIGNGGNTGCGQTFYQSYPFNAKSTVNVINLKNAKLNPYIAMFLCTVIKLEKYRYNFGRGWSLEKMKLSKIKLPSINGKPDWQFMEDYIKSLPYSSSLC